MASRIILDPETLLAQAGEMQSLTAEYESLFSKVTGTLNDTNNNWSELLAHNFAGKISSAQQSFASITELLASGAAAAKNSATTMQSVDQSLFKVFGGEAGEGIISGQVQGMTDAWSWSREVCLDWNTRSWYTKTGYKLSTSSTAAIMTI